LVLALLGESILLEEVERSIIGGVVVPPKQVFILTVPGGLITQGIHGWNGIDIGAPAARPSRGG